jgi:predicted ATP-dependent endonuclease of OLD family
LNIFVGINNSGKTRILEYLNQKFENQIDYVSPDRLRVKPRSNFSFNQDVSSVIAQQALNRKSHQELGEIPAPDPIDEIIGLDDANRELLKDWHNKYFEKMTYVKNNENNSWEIPTIKIGGRTPGEQGSGSRAVFTLLVKLFDPKTTILAIDEPEISVEPPTQRKLFNLIKSISDGLNGLPKKKIFLATHSHLFLDRENMKNNFVVERNNGVNTIKQITNSEYLHDLVFRLLGHNPADLFFPSNVIVVEGESDFIYLSTVLSLLSLGSPQKNKVRIHYADGDSKITGATKSIDQMLKSVSYIPIYRDKLCVIFDKQTSSSKIDEVKQFLNDDGARVVELSKNGIEYFYPRHKLSEITAITEVNLDSKISEFIDLSNKNQKGIAQIGSFSGTKIELAQKVADTITDLTAIPEEIINILKVSIDKAFS